MDATSIQPNLIIDRRRHDDLLKDLCKQTSLDKKTLEAALEESDLRLVKVKKRTHISFFRDAVDQYLDLCDGEPRSITLYGSTHRSRMLFRLELFRALRKRGYTWPLTLREVSSPQDLPRSSESIFIGWNNTSDPKEVLNNTVTNGAYTIDLTYFETTSCTWTQEYC